MHHYLTFVQHPLPAGDHADMLRSEPERHYRQLPTFYRERRDTCLLMRCVPAVWKFCPAEGTRFLLADASAVSDLDDVNLPLAHHRDRRRGDPAVGVLCQLFPHG